MFGIKGPAGVGRDYRSFRRFIRIMETMGTYGFHDLAENLYPNHKFHWMERANGIRKMSRPEKLRAMFEELGPTFVKLGQILSTRGDLIGAPYAQELTKLTEQVSPFPIDEVRKIIEEELKHPIGELYAMFDEKPLAAASIGQVHCARLFSGQEVVVKVRRPGIIEVIETDLAIMRYIASKMEDYSPTFARMEPVRIVSEFAYSLSREINYQFEAANLLRFAKNMEGVEHMKVPEVHLDLCTMRVMTMERLYGDSVSKVLADPKIAAKYDLKLMAQVGVNSLLSQIFEYGFFHADPHPGNIFLLDGNVLAFIDFGMMGRVSVAERHDFVKIVDYMLRGEISLMTDSALRMTITGKFAGSREELERDVADMVDENINLPMDKISVSHILEELLELFDKYDLAIKPNLYMMFKALITIEHIGRSFDRELLLIEMVRPFITRLKLQGLNPKAHIMRFLDGFGENLAALESLPLSLRNIISRFEEGQLTLRVEHHRLDDIEETLYVTGERLSRSLLVSALLVGSALIVVSRIPPFWGDIPLIGMFGFMVAGVLSIIILIADHRQRRGFLRDRMKRKKEEARRKQ